MFFQLLVPQSTAQACTAPATIYLCWVPRSLARSPVPELRVLICSGQDKQQLLQMEGQALPGHKGQVTAVGASFLVANTTETVTNPLLTVILEELAGLSSPVKRRSNHYHKKRS